MAKIIPVPVFDCVVFGATGDLTLRKLLPALYYRFHEGQMPPEARIFGAARSNLHDDALRDRTRQALSKHVMAEALEPAQVDAFCERVHYVAIDGANPDSDWTALKDALDPERVRVFYLATSPDLYGPICRNLKAAGLVTDQARVVLEKADRPRPRIPRARSMTTWGRCSPRRRPSASTITWARKRCRT